MMIWNFIARVVISCVVYSCLVVALFLLSGSKDKKEMMGVIFIVNVVTIVATYVERFIV